MRTLLSNYRGRKKHKIVVNDVERLVIEKGCIVAFWTTYTPTGELELTYETEPREDDAIYRLKIKEIPTYWEDSKEHFVQLTRAKPKNK